MSSRRLAVVGAVAVALAMVAGACAEADPSGEADGATTAPAEQTTTTPAPGAPPSTTTTPDLARATARLVRVADVSAPTAMAVRPGDDSVYVAEKSGRVRRVPRGQTATPGPAEAAPVLDLSGDVSTGSEQGLLGVTFSPDGSRLYVNYTDRAGDTRVVEYPFAGGRADPAGRREILFVDQPFANHNGGQVTFGPDGRLYVGLGDGGSGNDPGDRAQNLGVLLGKLLRIDPTPAADLPYTVPPDNPFVGRSGARPEVWMYGLRNPWRFSFDRETGDLWIADVGQNAVEEIDFLAGASPPGANFGWPLVEGSRRVKGSNPAGAVLPIFEYGHDEGCSVTGGYVYRGARVPQLRGVYVYGDACSGKVWGLVQSGGRVIDQRELQLQGLGGLDGSPRFSISSFGEDAAGELYLLDLGGGLFRFE